MMVGKYILSIDQGTTSSRAVLFDSFGGVAGMGQREFPQIYPQPGYVEHDAVQILQTTLYAMRQAVEKAGVHARDIAAISITNQRETTVAWDCLLYTSPLDGGVGPNGVQVRLEGHSQLFSHSLAPFLVVVPQAAQLSLGVFLDGFRVLLGVDVPRPYSCNFHGIVLPKEKNFSAYTIAPVGAKSKRFFTKPQKKNAPNGAPSFTGIFG